VFTPLPMVRHTTARLAEKGVCEQGLWWCSGCSAKGFVSLIVPGTLGDDASRTASPAPPVPPKRPRRRWRR